MNKNVLAKVEQEDLMRFLDGEVTPEERAVVEQYLETSSELRREVAIFRSMKEELQDLSFAAPVEDSWKRIRSRITVPTGWGAGRVRPGCLGRLRNLGLRQVAFGHPDEACDRGDRDWHPGPPGPRDLGTVARLRERSLQGRSSMIVATTEKRCRVRRRTHAGHGPGEFGPCPAYGNGSGRELAQPGRRRGLRIHQAACGSAGTGCRPDGRRGGGAWAPTGFWRSVFSRPRSAGKGRRWCVTGTAVELRAAAHAPGRAGRVAEKGARSPCHSCVGRPDAAGFIPRMSVPRPPHAAATSVPSASGESAR